MTTAEPGIPTELKSYISENNLTNFTPGRIIAEHKERYIVITGEGEFEAEVTGNLRFSAASREDFPAVGDWVMLTTYDHGFAIIHSVLPRKSVLTRSGSAATGESQIIAANVDVAFLVQAAERDFNLNRLERYLSICSTAGVEPVFILTKTDLADPERLKEITESINRRVSGLRVCPVSSQTGSGFDELKKLIEPGKTYCFLGSSGVGKSTLINKLSGREIMATGAISESTNKGRHVTSHRELVILEGGGILIDNPGMREVGVADKAEGTEAVFDLIHQYAENCKFKDCTHTSETGCAVINAVESGEIDDAMYQNYLKIRKEQIYYESTDYERRKKEKVFGKFMKNYKKDLKKNKF